LNLPNPISLNWLRELIDMTIAARSNDLFVGRVERDARALLCRNVAQPELCWLVLAFTAYLRGDRHSCVRAIDAAYALGKDSLVIVSNAASLLINLGLPRIAVDYARRLSALADGDARQTAGAVSVLYKALHLEEAAQLSRKIVQLPLHEEERPRETLLARLAAAFKARNVSLEVRVALIETAVSAVEGAGCSVRYTAPDHYPDDTLRYELYVDRPGSQCATLSFAIAEALTSEFDDAFPELITFVCRPLASYIPAGRLIELAA
jgi:hypothetical protein